MHLGKSSKPAKRWQRTSRMWIKIRIRIKEVQMRSRILQLLDNQKSSLEVKKKRNQRRILIFKVHLDVKVKHFL